MRRRRRGDAGFFYIHLRGASASSRHFAAVIVSGCAGKTGGLAVFRADRVIYVCLSECGIALFVRVCGILNRDPWNQWIIRRGWDFIGIREFEFGMH